MPPIIFWKFDSSDLPDEAKILETPSMSGDECHRDITALSDKNAEAFYKQKVPNKNISNFFICENDCAREFTKNDIKKLPQKAG